MGWWSEDIMGGDTPLDFQISIFEKIGSAWDAKPNAQKKAFDKASLKDLQNLIPKIVKKWGCGKPGEDLHTNETSVGYQVLAHEMMRVGADIQTPLKEEMLKWIPQDGWAQEDDDRRKKIDQLLEKLLNYTGTPIEIKNKGLLEVYYEKISANS